MGVDKFGGAQLASHYQQRTFGYQRRYVNAF